MGHGHDHGHAHGGAGQSLGIAFALNFGFTILELVGAWFTGSTAIAADAVHDLGDTLALAFAWGMQGLAGRRPQGAWSYGTRRLSLVGALVNGIVLLVGGAVVLRESIPRLWDPVQPMPEGMLALAIVGVLVNGAAAWRVGRGSTLNETMVSWHLIEDVLGWVAVLIVGIVLLFVDLPVLDPLLALLITAWVGFNAVRNLWSTVKLFLQTVPDDVDVEALRALAKQVDGVRDLAHVHVWSLEGEHHVLTATLQLAHAPLEQAIATRERVRHDLVHAGIEHVTLEISLEADPGCSGAVAHAHDAATPGGAHEAH